MSNSSKFTSGYGDEIIINYNNSTYYGEPEIMHCVRAYQDNQLIGELYADLATGQIMQIEVNKDRRREGIARAIYEYATEKFNIFHSADEHCTLEGLAFKKAVGGEEISPGLAYQP